MDDTIYQDDTCESCISDHDNHRSIGQIRNLMKLAHTGETQFSFKTVDVTVIKKHLKNININKATGYDLLPPKTTQTWVTHFMLSTVLYTQYVLHLWYVSRHS